MDERIYWEKGGEERRRMWGRSTSMSDTYHSDKGSFVFTLRFLAENILRHTLYAFPRKKLEEKKYLYIFSWTHCFPPYFE